MTARRRGFTILELMIAMALFMVLGTALIALITRAMDFLDAGAGGAELQDKGADFLRAFVSDMENVAVERSLVPGPPLIRFLSDSVPIDSDGDSKPDLFAQRVAFVRSTNADVTDPVARRGGQGTTADAYYDGKDDKEEADQLKLRALGGLEEVLYMAVPEPPPLPGTGGEAGVPAPPPPDPAVLTLYRAVRSPVGGKGSLLDRDTVKSIADLKRVGQPFLAGVLHFGVKFWSSRTTTWDAIPVPGRSDAPFVTWDSTRGILPMGVGRNEFPLAKGTSSLSDPRDDISPRMALVTFVFERTGRAADIEYLLGNLDESGKRFDVRGTTAFAAASILPYVKVGTEWVSYASRTDDRFEIRERGAWGTEAMPHRDGTKLRSGVAVERTIMIPNYREDWNTR